MLLIDRYIFLLITIVLFFCGALFSTNFADSVCYVFIFISVLSLKVNLEVTDIGILSIFADVFSHRFIGISFVAYVSVYLLTIKYRTALRNFHSRERIYYFLLILCCMKFVVFSFVILMGGKFNFVEHLMQIVYSIALITGYYICCDIRKRMSHAF